MSTDIKLLMAVGLALLVVMGTGAWARSRSSARKALEIEILNQKNQIAEAKSSSAFVSELEKRLEAVREDIEKKAVKLSARDEEGFRIVQAIVKSAAGMEMTGVSEEAPGGRFGNQDITAVPINIVSYRVSMEGPYAGLVEFFRNVASWELENRIEGVEILGPRDDKMETSHEIEADFTLSIFSMN